MFTKKVLTLTGYFCTTCFLVTFPEQNIKATDITSVGSIYQLYSLIMLPNYIVIFPILTIYYVDTSVLKSGIEAPLTINEMFTPLGVMYMKGSFFQLIFPGRYHFFNQLYFIILQVITGTKWCGDGDIANNYDHLGTFSDTDKCCRAHDFCEDVLYHGEMKETLINTHRFTRYQLINY